MKEVKIKLYKFEELEEEQQEKIIEKYYDINLDYDWWDFLYYEFKEDLEKIGISCETFYFDLGRGSHIYMDKAYVDDERKFLKHCGYDLRTKKARIIIEETGLQIKANRHSNYVLFDYEYDEEFTEILNDKLMEFWKVLDKEYYYLMSDEAIKDTLIANEYEFRKDDNEIWG